MTVCRCLDISLESDGKMVLLWNIFWNKNKVFTSHDKLGPENDAHFLFLSVLIICMCHFMKFVVYGFDITNFLLVVLTHFYVTYVLLHTGFSDHQNLAVQDINGWSNLEFVLFSLIISSKTWNIAAKWSKDKFLEVL